MRLRADKSILSVLALATALAVSDGAVAQSYPNNPRDTSWSLRPAVRLAQQSDRQSQWPAADPDEAIDGQSQDGRRWSEPEQTPRYDQPAPEFHEGDPRDDEPYDRDGDQRDQTVPDQNAPGHAPHEHDPRGNDLRRQPPADLPSGGQNQPDADDSEQGPGEDPRNFQDRQYERQQDGQQRGRPDYPRPPADRDGQDPEASPDDSADPDDLDEARTQQRQQTLITLYEEPAATPANKAAAASTPPDSAPAPQVQEAGSVHPPVSAATGVDANSAAKNATDVTASISRAPLPESAAPADDAQRPLANLQPSFPSLTPPPAVDTAKILQADAVLTLARALLETPATFAGSRLDSAQQARLRAFYAERTTPLWLERGQWTAAAKAAQARFEHAWEEGLEPADYPTPRVEDNRGATGALAPDVLADAEVRQSINAVKYARDASGGRLDPPRLSRHLTPKLDLPDSADVLTRLAGAAAAGQDAGALLGDYNPKHAGYIALRGKLLELRAARPPEPQMAKVPAGPVLRIGMSDPRVTLVRSRLGLTPSDDVSYDERLAAAVAEFQRSRGLKPTGNLTRQTVIAMAGGDVPAAQDQTALIVNMERWRWLPRELGSNYIFVNIPEYRMRVVRDGQVAHEARVVVGKAETPTPVFSDTMQYTVVNPYWNVPPSIMKNEFIPGLARDPNYAARRGYEVIRRGNRIHVRQPPGERNALGHIKFMFPNNHAVYLHDTPSRALFGRDRRAFSHGCVRVDDPMKFAELVLGPQWPQSRIKRLVGRGERTVRLPEQMPIHLAYFTASVDQRGALHTREDIYGIDRLMRAALDRLRS